MSELRDKVEVGGFQDVTAIFDSACEGLQLGQMVHLQGFTMMDSMGAIQIMDRRMDSGMAPSEKDTPENDRLLPNEIAQAQPFNVDLDLSIQETCWIIDRLLACETCWHSGSALAQTIQTCLYVHNVDFLYSGHGDGDGGLPETLASTVLRAYAVAVLKCCGMAWNVLSKNGLLDGEDWTGDKAGCSLLEDLDPEHVLSLLEDTINSLRRKDGCFALITRLQFRKHLLISMAIIDDANLQDLSELQMHAHFLKSSIMALIPDPAADTELPPSSQAQTETAFMKLGRVDAPTLRVKTAFDPNFSRNVTSTVPLRPITLPDIWRIRSFWIEWANGLRFLVDFANGPSMGLGWTHWQNYIRLRASQFQASHPAPFLRAALQSGSSKAVICSRDLLVAGRFPPIWHAHAYLHEIAAVDIRELSSAVAMQSHSARRLADEHTPNRRPGLPETTSNLSWQALAVRQKTLNQALDSFHERLAGNLASYLNVFCQNRPRQKRNLAKACKQWNLLAEEAQEIEKRLSTELKLDIPSDVYYAAIQHLILDSMLDILFAGFELELYRIDEWDSTYWLAAQVAREQSDLCLEFADVLERSVQGHELSESHDRVALNLAVKRSAALLRHRATYADMLARQCQGQLAFNCFCFRLGIVKGSEQGGLPSATTDKRLLAVFRRRLKWVESAPRLQRKAHQFWERFCEDRERLRATGIQKLSNLVVSHFEAVDQACTRLASASASEANTQLCGQLYSQNLERLRFVARANKQTCMMYPQSVAKTTVGTGKWAFDLHAWFPSLSGIPQKS
ncbi:N-alpha-acetyltransferase, non-catalitic subunit [Tilletia horrida]|uniref:N-alpha-acetyltransferase, non-catalitic subunit n=1 Tax=Tilletia horrida TaxID=155126 RepID=A0AAN6GX27_9BASI|nr:N-alpha-acetyltransferase, non-catalitic subunit [Tilletia horrida]